MLPALLTLSLEHNLRPTAAALRDAGLLDVPLRPDGAGAGVDGGGDGGGEDANLPKTALRPRHLAASLDGRVRPRLAFAEHCRAADATSSVDGSDGADGAGDAGGAGGLARSRRKLSLGAVTTMSDGAFAEALGATPEQYDQFKKSWMQRNSLTGSVKRAKSADGSEGGLDISWLPEGFDLAAQVLAMEDSSAGEGNAPDGDGEQGTLAYDGRRRR